MNISHIAADQASEARQIVLQGFKERFGIIIEGLNPDLDDIMDYYQDNKYFYVGERKGELMATGGIIFETPTECRIVRMSVSSPYRSYGFGRAMLSFLEEEARRRKASNTMLETNKNWDDAVHFYQKNGYIPYRFEGERIHFRKKLLT
ncbi:GNAT family N-acetyltransferase [Bacillus sp. SCS-153A]|uniref:GNAT family N-acetyltransferase n=1 Tax=Rossellomorea sedimentorum TaxID=3115294 RepID=UPI0039065AB1